MEERPILLSYFLSEYNSSIGMRINYNLTKYILGPDIRYLGQKFGIYSGPCLPEPKSKNKKRR